MTHRRFLASLLLAAVVLLPACSEDVPVADQSFGSLNPSTYVAVGNSLTAGYQSGALFEEGQRYSYPNLIAQRLGVTFVQPLMPYPGTGELRYLESMSPSVVIKAKTQGQVLPSNATHPAPYHNLGIPGAIMADAIDESDIIQRSVTRQNPFYALIMRNQANFGASLLDQAIKLNPTVMTFWMGNNDVLGYAATGGTKGTNVGLDGNPPGTRPTDRAFFQQRVQGAFAKIKAALPNTKVLVANLPNPLSTPFFTTVPRKIPNPQNPTQLLSIYYRNHNDQVTTVSDNDYVLLTAQEFLQQGIGLSPQQPLPSRYVLDDVEVSIVLEAVSSCNSTLDAAAAQNGFTMVDMYGFFNDIHKNGYAAVGEVFSTAFISGGIFSLDGLHLSAKGNAIVANKFIQTMNSAFGANIHYVQLHTLPGIPGPGRFTKRPASAWSPDLRVPSLLPSWLR
ncbi:MAG TPA: SGNH/GDSL hydrolase family protein [Bacteroidota bacterium]|nr:SGNH/GDSL hydrolase family protein [Bacteroidota bacterium]